MFTTSLRRPIVTIAACLIAVASVTAAASPANAGVYASAGQVGSAVMPRPDCKYKPAWGQVQLIAPPPTIYASNTRYGYGNDWQPVRYRVFVVDYATGQTVTSSGYSAAVWAGDNSAATFSGSTVFNLSARGQYRLDYRVEWLRYSDLAVTGWVADRVTKYHYYDGYNVGPLGPTDRCMAI